MNSYVVGQDHLIGACRSPAGVDGIGVLVKRALSFRDRREVPTHILMEPLHEGDALVADADAFSVHKPCVDITVAGHAYCPRPTPCLLVSAQIGVAHRRLRVYGERRVRARNGTVQIEQQEMLHGEQLLAYSNAYGGFVGRAPARMTRGAFGARRKAAIDPSYQVYPRNSAGRGFTTRDFVQALDGSLAPSQELEDDPVTAERLVRANELDWPSGPLHGHFGPVAMGWFPRVQWVVPFSKTALGQGLAEARLNGMSDEDCDRPLGPADARALSCAAPGLALPSLDGVVPVALAGLRWGAGSARFTVDVSAPRVRLRFPNAGDYDVTTHLKTFAVDADGEHVSLLWAGFQPTALPYLADDLVGIDVEVRYR